VASAAILNGGDARRFGGRDKGSLIVGGRTIRDRQLTALSAISNDIMIAGGHIDGPFRVAVRLVPDRYPGRGPLAGLEAALGAARDELTAVVACDMPCVTADLLARLLEMAAEVDVVVPRTESGYHPLCAVYRRTCLPVVSERLDAERLAMRGLFASLRVREVSERELAAFGDPLRLLANVNTPAQYGELEALLIHEL
jgi:molybdopterin-guanine dinucleotide biosynthesis protein A